MSKRVGPTHRTITRSKINIIPMGVRRARVPVRTLALNQPHTPARAKGKIVGHINVAAIPYTPLMRRMLRRQVNGQGGYQNLLRKIQTIMRTKGQYPVTEDELRMLSRYATRYGEGGFQGRVRAILSQYVATVVRS